MSRQAALRNVSRRALQRQRRAQGVRNEAAQVAADREHPAHESNGDETRWKGPNGENNYVMSFTKGLQHNATTGLVNDPDHFVRLVKAIDTGNPALFADTPLGPDALTLGNLNPAAPAPGPTWASQRGNGTIPLPSGFPRSDPPKGSDGTKARVRAWESPSAGLSFDLQGPDAQAVTMPPAPALDSRELAVEMAEVYTSALLRDVNFNDINDLQSTQPALQSLQTLLDRNRYSRTLEDLGSDKDARKLLRGQLQGDKIGPYISQFLLVGNEGFDSRGRADLQIENGRIRYGAMTMDQRVRYALPQVDYMQTWDEWLDVQNGADFRGHELYHQSIDYRFITTPRDLATYVHHDALYQAYLNACLILLARGAPLDPGIPFGVDDVFDHQQGFALFGGPHILSLVTEVATRALKAVRYQKFNIHRRARPEVLAARLEKASASKSHQDSESDSDSPDNGDVQPQKRARTVDKSSDIQNTDSDRALRKMSRRLEDVIGLIRRHNPSGTALLPMAFPEGSPMHPAYGAGHATVAGACVTILKAFFDHKHRLDFTGQGPGYGYVSQSDESGASQLVSVPIRDIYGNVSELTVEGELNKLASNISIGRNWAGVHYYSDYMDSIRMGEEIAIGILEEQKLTYHENFSMTVPLFDGGERVI